MQNSPYNPELTNQYPGLKVHKDFTIMFSRNPNKTSKPHKIVNIEGKNTHARLNLTIRKMVNQIDVKSYSVNLDDKTNYLVADIGFVVSTEKHEQNGNHDRKFISMPINVPSQKEEEEYIETQKEVKDSQRRSHSEQAVIQFLKTDTFFQSLLDFFNKENVKPGYKVYAIVLDMHSTHTMCNHSANETYDACEKTVLIEQKNPQLLRENLQEKLRDEGFIIPGKSLRMISRVSADKAHGGFGNKSYNGTLPKTHDINDANYTNDTILEYVHRSKHIAHYFTKDNFESISKQTLFVSTANKRQNNGKSLEENDNLKIHDGVYMENTTLTLK
jgi:hypothetical protein